MLLLSPPLWMSPGAAGQPTAASFLLTCPRPSPASNFPARPYRPHPIHPTFGSSDSLPRRLRLTASTTPTRPSSSSSLLRLPGPLASTTSPRREPESFSPDDKVGPSTPTSESTKTRGYSCTRIRRRRQERRSRNPIRDGEKNSYRNYATKQFVTVTPRNGFHTFCHISFPSTLADERFSAIDLLQQPQY